MSTQAIPSTRTDRITVDGQTLAIEELTAIARGEATVEISPEALSRVRATRALFESEVEAGQPVYGVTTGYGEMIYMHVGQMHEERLQTNLVRSHCAGVGPDFSRVEARAVVAARLNALAKGHSAVRPEVLHQLATYLNLDIVPAIPEIGSLGASGDLAPLAHVAVTLIGEGYCLEDGERVPTREVLARRGVAPITLRFKEGLALINGTSAMTGVGSVVLERARAQVRQAEAVTALVLEVQRASSSPFQKEGHDIARPHRGQVDCAANLRRLLEGSRLVVGHESLREEAVAQRESNDSDGVARTDVYLQKAYTLRAIPQIVGAVRDTLYRAEETFAVEINSANDNPLFFEGEEIFHGANFHGQPVAFVLDFLTIAMTQLGVTSERRTNRLVNRHLSDGLPEFLVPGAPGLNSGFAGAQYPATALVAENRTIGPASTQSVPSNGDNQDVVSMGLIAARNARRVTRNVAHILAVELLAAAQAVDIRDVAGDLGPAGRAVYDFVRSHVPMLQEDRYMADDIATIADLLHDGVLGEVVDEVVADLV